MNNIFPVYLIPFFHGYCLAIDIPNLNDKNKKMVVYLSEEYNKHIKQFYIQQYIGCTINTENIYCFICYDLEDLKMLENRYYNGC